MARIKCFVQIILRIIIASNVQQHKCALGFTTLAKQDSVCRRIRNFLSKFSFDSAEMARALVEISKRKGLLHLAIDRTNWKFGSIDINFLVLSYVERFLKNPLVDTEVVMAVYAEDSLVRLAKDQYTFVLMIDQSKVNAFEVLIQTST